MTTTKVNLANTVEGILPVANGGTGTSTGVAPGGSTTQVQYNNAGAFAGSANLVWDNTNARLGIGTTSPASQLEVKSAAFTDSIATINSTSTNVSQRLNFTANGTLQTQLYDDSTVTRLNAVTSKPLAFSTNNTERMRIDSSGNVGIGTSSPAEKLTVAGNVRTNASSGSNFFQFGTDTTGGYLYSNQATPFLFYTNGTERMRIASDGTVGVGVTPATWTTYKAIQVSSTGALAGASGGDFVVGNNYYYNGANRYLTSAPASFYYQYDGVHSWHTAPSGTAGNTATFTERFRIGNSGQLGIGGANYGSSGQVLTSQGSGSAPSWGAVSGTVNAWVLWNGSAISSSVNVSSVTNPATGAYTINFTTAFSSGTSFAALALGQGGGGTTDGDCAIDTSSYPRNSGSSITIVRKRTDNNARENGAFNAAFIGT